MSEKDTLRGLAEYQQPTFRLECLKCHEMFDSVDKKRNRICYQCNLSNSLHSKRVCSITMSNGRPMKHYGSQILDK